jgi:hypothetical protein
MSVNVNVSVNECVSVANVNECVSVAKGALGGV